MTDAPICHECGGVMRRDVRPDTIEYRGRTVTVEQPGWYCDACGKAVLTDEDAKATERAFLDLKAEVEGVLKPGWRSRPACLFVATIGLR